MEHTKILFSACAASAFVVHFTVCFRATLQSICCAFYCLFLHYNLPQIFSFKTYLLCPRLSLCRFPT